MDNDTVIRLRRVVLKLARQLNAASREEGLTPTQASVLGITTMRGPLSLAELTEIEGINPTMLSRVIGKLDEYGLLKRLRDPDDFRAARVEVTPKGRAVYERIVSATGTYGTQVTLTPGGTNRNYVYLMTTFKQAAAGGSTVALDASKKNHKEICTTPKEGSVTGVKGEMDGKKTIKVTKVEFK